ncbi:hypothetical protein THAOC_00269 [Thalassiosira oceanica]|uniref:Phosphoglucomutase n=1 Tax=Thalassiosira oceanica TaxID=159749 RepID=K3W4F8_THAOC|nr:hypothetical protein THAOC_00269 [Thalassiosira oceanica]|eukprot:EJK77864.1 hypothetical protein THAOC_00269 [Thalassiosira oceanica]
MSSDLAALRTAAEDWASLDPNPKTASHVTALLGRADREGEGGGAVAELRVLFGGPRISFGTAGLRGPMRPGPRSMNDLVVVQAAQGIASYIKDAEGGEVSPATRPTVVVGRDHRARGEFGLSSERFARYTKLVFDRAEIDCLLLEGLVATPILAFATRYLGATAGIMVTASHNPKDDNGYKVYWSGGCQIRPPMDREIAKAIDENLRPWTDYGAALAEAEAEGRGLGDGPRTEKIEEAYFLSVRALRTLPEDGGESDLKFAYTSMHGVGYPYAKRSFDEFGIPGPLLAVPSQRDADPAFPTVPFPNPEERGALNRAMEFAAENGCRVVLANDPDADRLGVAELADDGGWTAFTGDEIGALLGMWLLESFGRASSRPVAMIASTVSSNVLAAMADAEGFRFEETLTGFKWIGSRALSLREEGYDVLLGYEEAIGFSCGGVIPDKDGISALGVVASMATSLHGRGETLVSYLAGIYGKYGHFVSDNGYYRCNDPEVAARVIEGMRNGGKYRDRVGGYDVESVRDLGSPGYDSTTEDGRPTLPTSAASPMITFRFANGCVAQFRASGTEPKFKYYLELRGRPGESREDVEKRLRKMSGIVLEELVRPTEQGLILP